MYRNLFIREFINFALGNKKRAEYKARIVKFLGNKYRANDKEVTEKQKESINKEANRLIEIIDGFNNQRKEMAAVHWICNGKLRLPEDIGKLDDAVELMNRFDIDYTRFPGPVELINSVPREKRARVVTGSGDPDNYEELELAYKVDTSFGELKVYFVQDDRDGQMAVREIMNTQRGRDWKGPWCLLHGDGEGGLSEDSFGYWMDTYNGTRKKVAFFYGDIIAFCASSEKDVDEWWDMEDNPCSLIPLGESTIRPLNGMSLSELSKMCGNIFDIIPEWDSIKDKAICKQEEFYLMAYYDPDTNQVLWRPSIPGEEVEFGWETDGSSMVVTICEKGYYDTSSLLYIYKYYELTKDNKEIYKVYFDDGSIYDWTESDGTAKRRYSPDGRLLSEVIDENNTNIYKGVTGQKSGEIIYKKLWDDDIYRNIVWDIKGGIKSYRSNAENVPKIVFKDISSNATSSVKVNAIDLTWNHGKVFNILISSHRNHPYEIQKADDGSWDYYEGIFLKYKLKELPENLESLVNSVYKNYGKFVPEKYGMEDFFKKRKH